MALARWISLPQVQRTCPFRLQARGSGLLSVQWVPAPNQPGRRDDVRGHQVALQPNADFSAPIVAVVEPVRSFDNASLKDWVARRLAPGCTVYSDGLAKYARRSLAEAAYRFNRRFQLDQMLPRLAVALMRCKPCPEPVLKAACNFND